MAGSAAHQPGERQALVDWAGAAKGRPLRVKLFQAPGDAERLLAPPLECRGSSVAASGGAHLAVAPPWRALRPVRERSNRGSRQGCAIAMPALPCWLWHDQRILLLQCLGLNLSAPLTWPTWGW